jgi:hypothetical protein
MAGRRRRKKYSQLIRIGAFIIAAFLGVLMGVMVALLLNGKTPSRSEGATWCPPTRGPEISLRQKISTEFRSAI